jgi:hypothetical protein
VEGLPDEVVDAVKILPGEIVAVQGLAAACDPYARQVLAAFVTVGRGDGAFLVDGAARHQSRATSGASFAFPRAG